MKTFALTFICSLSLLCSSSQHAGVDLADGIIAYYPFSSNLNSRIAKLPMALLKGAQLATNRFGVSETAIVFGGADEHILLPIKEEISFLDYSDFSISLWIQPRDDNSGCILLKDGEVGIKWSGMRKPLTIFNGIANGFPQGTFDKWSSNDWYNLVMVRKGTSVNLYVNGKQDLTIQVVANGPIEPSDMYLGHHPYLWGDFTGKLDDIAIYDRALTEYEVMMLSQIENIPVETFEVPQQAQLSYKQFYGNWQGIVTQPGNEMVSNFAFWLNFKEVEDGRLQGYSRIEIQEDNAYGVSSIQAIISGNSLSFEEVQVMRQKNYMGYKWCKKYGQLIYNEEEDLITGKWYSDNCANEGEVFIYRTDNKFNFFDNRLSKIISKNDLLVKMEEMEMEEIFEEELVELDLQPIFFITNQALISTESQNYLAQELFPLLKKFPQLKLIIAGHTDNVGDDNLNLKLSISRAKVISDYIIQQGNIEPNRISYEGFGEAKPIASNLTKEGRAKNRRVEFRLSY